MTARAILTKKELVDCAAELSRGVGEDCGAWLIPAFTKQQLNATMLEDPGQLAIFWHKTHDRHLFIAGAISLDRKTVVHGLMFAAFESLARTHDCSAIEYCTKRPGLFRLSARNGYSQIARLYRKTL